MSEHKAPEVVESKERELENLNKYEVFERRKVKWDPEDEEKMARYNDILNITLPPIIQFWDSPSSIPVLSAIISETFVKAAEESFGYSQPKPRNPKSMQPKKSQGGSEGGGVHNTLHFLLSPCQQKM